MTTTDDTVPQMMDAQAECASIISHKPETSSKARGEPEDGKTHCLNLSESSGTSTGSLEAFDVPINPTSRRSRMVPMTRILPEGSAGAVTHWLPSQWPRPGGVALLPLAEDAFLTEDYLSTYRPGYLTAIYAAGCGRDHANASAAGLLGLARKVKAALHKVGVTSQTNPRNRMRELSRVRYGALTTSEDGYECSDLGYDTWALTHIMPHGQPLPGSPVSIGNMVLNVRLPHDLESEEFDKRLDARMQDASLEAWLRSAEGREHCAFLGIKPETLIRKSSYRFSDSMRRSKTTEIYFFRPKSRDADRLMRLAEVIIHEHVTMPGTRTQVSYRSLGQGLREDFSAM